MGFQVSFSIRRKKLQPTIGNAGEDQFITCAPGSTLTATVTGSDVNSASFLWEQIDGPAVTWLTSLDLLVVSFEKNILAGNVNQDVQFRFWVNKGTPVEQFSDIWVYSTPTSFGSIGSQYVMNITAYRNVDTTDFPVGGSSTIQVIPSLTVDGGYQLRWNSPANPHLIVQTDVQQFINGAWETIGITTGKTSFFDGIDPTQSYRLIVTKNRTELGVVSDFTHFTSLPSQRLPDDLTYYSAGTSGVEFGINSNSVYNQTYIERTLINLQGLQSEGSSGVSYASNVNTIYNVVTIERTITGCPPGDSYGTISVSGYAGANTIYNHAVVQIGGVVVGG